jgi:hypothetical protein
MMQAVGALRRRRFSVGGVHAAMTISKGPRLLIGYGFVLVLILIISFVGKACALRTASYTAADHFIKVNVKVLAKLGTVEETSLVWYKFMSGGYARFKIALRGTKDHGIANLDLEKQQGIWRVTAASLTASSGEVVPLR